MSVISTYDQVRAAYGLDDDDLRDLASDSSAPPSIRRDRDTAQESGYNAGNSSDVNDGSDGRDGRNGINPRNGSNGGSGNGFSSRGHIAAATHNLGIPTHTQTSQLSSIEPYFSSRASSSEDGGVRIGDSHLIPDYADSWSNGSSDRDGNGNGSVARRTGQNAQRPRHADYSSMSQSRFGYGQPTHPSMQFKYSRCTGQTAGVPQPPPPTPPSIAPIVKQPLKKANSVCAPFNPEGQSGNKYAQPATHDGPAASQRKPPTTKLIATAAPFVPMGLPALAKVNSVRVPFDPEDQSDDEVVTTSAYNRGVRNDEYARPTTHNEPAGSQRKPPTTTLLANAASFVPESASLAVFESRVPPKPLVGISSLKGNPSILAVVGEKFPQNRLGFVPWILVSNYHLWFVGRTNSKLVMPYFKEEALLEAQTWDFCYIWRQPKGRKADPILLVPTAQFEHFMERINRTLEIQLCIPSDREGEKFRVQFGDKTPVPRFLGHASDEKTFKTMVQNVPAMDAQDKTDGLSPPVAALYAKKVESLLFTYDKSKTAIKKAKAEKSKFKHKMGREAVGRQIKRVQRYLGLRPNSAKTARVPPVGEIDLTKPVPHAREEDVILVSMDIEAYELNQVLTEIGFGILDTRDIANVPPGAQCSGWFEQIQGRHIRIQERAHMINRKYLMGNEENFNFGKTEFVKIQDVLKIMVDVLQPGLASGKPRKVILVGHNIKSDIKMIQSIGYNVQPGAFFEILDTQDIHQHFRMQERGSGLGSMLNDLEIDHSFMHNGGNDAVYTLQALLSLVVKKRQGSLWRQKQGSKSGFVLDADVVAQGWASGGENSDGGYAVNGQSQI